VVISGLPPYALQAWGDDSQTPEKDGFASGEDLVFRMWDSGGQKEYGPPVAVTYVTGDGKWGTGTYARINPMEFLSTRTVTLDLPLGWSWISINVTPPDPDMEVMWQDVSNLKIVKGYGGFYIPGVFNGIGAWNIKEMYVPYVDPEDQLVVEGEPVDPSTPIELSEGWNWVSYLPDEAINAELALASVVDNLNIAKAYTGFYIPGLFNGIGDMKPGQGYKLHLKQAATLIYPSGGGRPTLAKAGILPRTKLLPGKHFVPQARTADYYSVLVKSVRIEGKEVEVGDELGVFTESGLCVGSVVLAGEFPVGIMAWADDAQTEEVEGFKAGEVMVFKLWDASEEREYEVVSTVLQGSERFGESPMSVVAITGIAASPIPTTFALEQNYPNPFNSETTIKYQLPEAGKVTLRIFNVLGQEVRTLVDGVKEAGYYEVHWDGLDNGGRSVSAGIYIYRIQAGEFKQTRKMLFLE